MMQFVIGLLVGLGLGSVVGVFTLSLLMASKNEYGTSSESDIQMSTNPQAMEQDKAARG